MKYLLAALFVLGILGSFATHAQSLRESMTEREFERAGLDKLSASELEFLEAWLRGDREQTEAALSEAEAALATAEAERARAEAELAEAKVESPDDRGLQKADDDQPIESRIVGTFNGWTGRTVFKLENGQVWRQTRGGTYRSSTQENPSVTIEPKLLGSWSMKVDGVSRRVRVERVR